MPDRLDELIDRFKNEPLAQDYGIKMDLLFDGACMLSLDVTKKMTIVGGVAQGGVTTVLADYAAVYAAMTAIPAGHTPCRNISIHFMRPVLKGEHVHALADVVNETRQAVLVKVKVVGSSRPEKLKATALMEFAKPSA